MRSSSWQTAIGCTAWLLLSPLVLLSGNAVDGRDLYRALTTDPKPTAAVTEILKAVSDHDPLALKSDTRPFQFHSVRKLDLDNTRSLALVLLAREERLFNNNVHASGFEFPEFLHAARLPPALIWVNDQGKALSRLQSPDSMMLLDLNGDGKAHELVRWSKWNVGTQPAYLAVHDVKNPKLPLLFHVQLNPEEGGKPFYSVLVPAEADGMPGVGQRQAAMVKQVRKGLGYQPKRTGRVRLEREGKDGSSGPYRILIDEFESNKDGNGKAKRWVTKAEFKWDAAQKTWTGPAGDDDAIWKLDERKDPLKIQRAQWKDLSIPHEDPDKKTYPKNEHKEDTF